MNLKDYKDYLIKVRRYFHKHPESGFNVQNTLKYINNELKSFGFTTYFEDTGLIGIFQNGDGRVIALRSDVDALEIPDLTNKSYSSEIPNKNHACGHDGHIAMLLGACKFLSNNKDFFKGTLKVIFQAAEEGPLPGGASSLSLSEHLSDVEEYFALHIMSDYPIGSIISREGPLMASVDIINIKIYGKSTHVANPHLGLNPIDVIPELLDRLKNLVKEENSLLGITQISSGQTHNVIPDLCFIRGSLRTFNEEYRKKIKHNINKTCDELTIKYKTTIEVNIEEGYPSVYNDISLYNRYRDMIVNNYKEINFIELNNPSLLSEDFSYFQAQSRGIMAFIGCKNIVKNIIFPNHHYQFDIDEDVLEIGMKIHLLTIAKFLN